MPSPDVERDVALRERLAEYAEWGGSDSVYAYALARIEELEGALRWVEEFALKMSDRYTGFVHVERRARAALAEPEK